MYPRDSDRKYTPRISAPWSWQGTRSVEFEGPDLRAFCAELEAVVCRERAGVVCCEEGKLSVITRGDDVVKFPAPGLNVGAGIFKGFAGSLMLGFD
jgi:hypothetical protein